ncbi:GspH/FimT family pseudopilin [Tissierella sp.]|uniref:GspH/FimT family pseudopilin n=1 Tax=Tissierella sp. TaxID=41274 RepID=UPI0028ABF3AA|nr:prepilin-type N-terminal cleavage/methylation domain-containing protein [Tissierella sp.]
MNGNIDNGRFSTKKGYTLVELIVTIALLAIVISIGIPSVKVIFNTREKKELMEFRRDIIFARNSAVVENCIYALTIDVNKNGYIITKDSGVGMKIIKNIKFSNGIKIKGNNFNGYTKFYPNGAPNNSGTILLINKKKQIIEITITPATGKVNLYVNGR